MQQQQNQQHAAFSNPAAPPGMMPTAG